MGIQGDFEFFNQKDFGRVQNQSHMALILYILFTLLVNVVALNALIALLGDSFDKVMDKKELQSRRQKAELIVEYLTVNTGRVRDDIEEKTKWGFYLTPCDNELSVQDGGKGSEAEGGRSLVKIITKVFKKELKGFIDSDNIEDARTFGEMISGLKRDVQKQFDQQNEHYNKSDMQGKFMEMHGRIDGVEKSLKALQKSNDSIMRVMVSLAKKEGVSVGAGGGRDSDDEADELKLDDVVDLHVQEQPDGGAL